MTPRELAIVFLLAAIGCVPAETPLRAPAMPAGAIELQPVRSPDDGPMRVRASAWVTSFGAGSGSGSGARVAGIVGATHDEHGQPTPGVTLVLTDAAGSACCTETAITDDDGAFQLVQRPGHYTLTLYYLDSTAALQVAIEPGATTHVDFILDMSKVPQGEI